MKTGHFPLGDEPAEDISMPFELEDEETCVVSSPARAARDTAARLSSRFTIEPSFDDIDYGKWRGRSLRKISEDDPDGLAAWLSDPHANPHGGESMAMLAERTDAALKQILADATWQRCVVVTHAIVVRAALSIVLGEPLTCILKRDVAPLSLVTLTIDEGRWRYASP